MPSGRRREGLPIKRTVRRLSLLLFKPLFRRLCGLLCALALLFAHVPGLPGFSGPSGLTGLSSHSGPTGSSGLSSHSVLTGLWGLSSARAASAAPVEGSAPAVRVLLRRLALTDRIDLTLVGPFAASWGKDSRMLLPGGTSLSVICRNNRLILFFGGASLDCGTKLTLSRAADARIAVPGLRIAPGDALYPGDLTLTLSGGQLQPVLTLPVEDYLRGVVPYEMSDDFPLEALKAQAVCARTYALGRLNPSKEWDLVDTTADQVFRGLTGSHDRSDRAIRETAGLIGWSGGAVANCYYSASNGGQTELPSHVWAGAESSTCFAISDDPYDVENPASIVKKAVLRKDGANLPEALLSAVREAVLALPEMSDFDRDPASFRVDQISAVSLTSPRYPAPSRLMTKIELTLQASGRRYQAPETPDPLTYEPDEEELPASPGAVSDAVSASPSPSLTPTETPPPDRILSGFLPMGTFTLSLPLFPSLIRELGLSIYGADNEIVTVSEEKDRFVLTSGRYGHGVGMSQRGAQQMAEKHGKTFQEILAFYYPGMVLRQAETATAPLPTPDPVLAETPGPAATPTPRPTLIPVSAENLPEGAWLASVEGIDDDSSLNLRAEPAPSGEILRRLYKHQRLVVLEICEDPSWAHVRVGDLEGFVMISFLERVSE